MLEVKFNKKVNYRKIREELHREFDNKCGYCRSYIGGIEYSNVDHFYPRSLFPDLEFEKSNLILSCNYCNRIKGSRSPIGKNGKKIILNPREDIYNEHIKEESNGELVGLTELGISTIEVLDLNRRTLVEDRILRTVMNLMMNPDYKSIEPILNNEKSPYEIFQDSLSIVSKLLKVPIEDEIVQSHQYRLLYANVITSMETYLSDSFINQTIVNKENLKKFVSSFHDYKNMKFDYAEIFDRYEGIETYVTKTLLDVLYHNIAKVQGMYMDTLGVSFPKNLKKIYNAVSIRHDIVHRNGKDKDKNEHKIEKIQIEELISDVRKLIDHIEMQITFEN